MSVLYVFEHGGGKRKLKGMSAEFIAGFSTDSM